MAEPATASPQQTPPSDNFTSKTSTPDRPDSTTSNVENSAPPAGLFEPLPAQPGAEGDIPAGGPSAVFAPQQLEMPSMAGMSPKEKLMAQRRIIAEDPEWNLAPVPKLSELCVKIIVANFEKTPHLSTLPTKYRNLILSSISTSLPLSLAAPLIPDESYWSRRALATYKLCNIANHGNSWKRLFFEKHIQDVIENHIPKKSSSGMGTGAGREEEKKVVEEIRLAGSWVERLEIGQLRPVEMEEDEGEGSSGNGGAAGAAGGNGGLVGDAPKGYKNERDKRKEEESGVKELKIKPTDPPPDHMDLSLVFASLPGLMHLKLYYGVRDCGINFHRAYFGMTLPDCTYLCTALSRTQTLESLTIQASKIDDDRCRMICKSLLQNKSLKHL
ncbi:T-complex-associated testis-expressed protein 1, partial [Rhizophlyctis rosea]